MLFFPHYRRQLIGKSLLQAVRVLPTEAGSKVALRVSIHEKHLFALHSHSNAEVYCRGGFPHAAFWLHIAMVLQFGISLFLLLVRFGSLDPPKHRNRVLCFGGRI